MNLNIYDPNHALTHIIKAFEEIQTLRGSEIDYVHSQKNESANGDRTSNHVAENA